MDSDDDMHDANDVESINDEDEGEDEDDEGFYSDDDIGLDYYYSDVDAEIKHIMEDDAEDFQKIEDRRPEVSPIPV